jgi:hypothetical protein
MMDNLQHNSSKDDVVKKLALIVDDSKTARQLLKKLLESYGHEVLCAESAEQAIHMLNQKEQTHPDVIFMDHSMPGMDGLQALKTIKTNPSTAMIPILMYTSQGGAVYAEQAKRFGAVGIIPKELKHVALKQVLDTLDKIITRSKQGEHDFSDSNLPDEASTMATDNSQYKKPASIVSSPRPIPERARSVFSTGNLTEALSDFKTEVMQSEIKENTHPAPPENEGVLSESIHKRFLIDTIKVLQQQSQDLQSQVNRMHQQSLRSLRNLKSWLVGVSCTLAGIIFVLFLNAGPTDTRINTSTAIGASQNQQPLFPSLKEASVTLTNKIKEMPATNQDHAQMAMQLNLIQNLLNQNSAFNFNSPPFGDDQAKTIEHLTKLLTTLGFSGTIQLTAHFADFCMTEKNGTWEMANNNLPLEQCQFFSIENMSYTELQSLGFSNLLNSINPHTAEIKIAVNVQEELPEAISRPDKTTIKTAGKWNQLVSEHNRIEYQLIADGH